MNTRAEIFSLGYDKSCGSHKVLSLFHNNQNKVEIYDLSSNSWMVTDCTVAWGLDCSHSSVSLKGNTYWYATNFESIEIPDYLICFDFTRERFGLRLPLHVSFINHRRYSSSIHAFREEKLAVLLQRWNTSEMEIWVTDKIESDAVSWSKFLKVYERPTYVIPRNFLIDEENKVALLFHCNYVSMIGENGYCLRRVDLGDQFPPLAQSLCGLSLECTYVPSWVQIQ